MNNQRNSYVKKILWLASELENQEWNQGETREIQNFFLWVLLPTEKETKRWELEGIWRGKITWERFETYQTRSGRAQWCRAREENPKTSNKSKLEHGDDAL